jgi:probable regulatory domain-containing protein
MPELTPQPVDVDRQALEVFLKAIELAGGPRGLIEHRRLTWLPSLMEAAYAVVLQEAHRWNVQAISRFLGLSTATVRLMLRASTEAVRERLQKAEPEEHTHIAGGLARLAWQELLRAQPSSSP